jgi:hypothetical protein
MFANQRRGTAGLGSIGAVALVLVGWLVATGVFVKVYQEGGTPSFIESPNCQVVCSR